MHCFGATTSNPSRYNPLTHPKENAVRRKIVLEKMYEQNFITYDQKNDALDDDVYSRIQTVDNATFRQYGLFLFYRCCI